MAIYNSQIHCELREISLKNKPPSMLNASKKGTVPVLVLNDSHVLDESIDIMKWALQQADPSAWLEFENTMTQAERDELINHNDTEFKYHLDRYKYFDRHPEKPQDYYLDKALPFLIKLETILSKAPYIGGSKLRLADAAIMPFIRQFSMVDQAKFSQLPLPKLQAWLNQFLSNNVFINTMEKHPIWNEGDDLVLLNNP